MLAFVVDMAPRCFLWPRGVGMVARAGRESPLYDMRVLAREIAAVVSTGLLR